MNLRLRDDLDQAVRIQAARLGVFPRDVVEQLVADAVPSWSPDPAQRADDTGTRVPVEAAEQQAGDARTPRRKGRKDRADKSAERAGSGEAGDRGQQPVDVAGQSRQPCPECPGELYSDPDVPRLVCDQCNAAFPAPVK